jgi:hypothetical protein
MRKLTKFKRQYKAEFSVGVIRKLMSLERNVIFTRKEFLDSFKVSARFFKFAEGFSSFFAKSDMLTLYLTGVGNEFLNNILKDNVFLLIYLWSKKYYFFTFEDFKKLDFNKSYEFFVDNLNIYLQQFIQIPNDNLQSIN